MTLATHVEATAPPRSRDHGNAHWWLIAALLAIIAGFWESFFRPMGARSTAHTIHAASSTLWILTLITQSWLITNRQRQWHRRLAYAAGVLLVVMVVSGLQMIAVMLTAQQMPIELARLLAFLDFGTIAFLVLLVVLGVQARRRPVEHRRYMASTVLLAFPPALTRLFAFGTPWPLDFVPALHLSMVVPDLILVVLIVRDRMAGRSARAYPMTLAFFVIMHVLMFTTSGSAMFVACSEGFARLLGY